MRVLTEYLDRYVTWVRRVFRNHLRLGYWFYMVTVMGALTVCAFAPALCLLAALSAAFGLVVMAGMT